MSERREKFFSWPALLILGCLVSVALYALYPRQAIIDQAGYLETPDALSIAYLDVLVQSDPDNADLRLTLVRMLRETGQNLRARRTLASLLQNPTVPFAAYAEQIRIQANLVYEVPAGPSRVIRRLRLHRDLRQMMLHQDYSMNQILTLMDPARDWLQPRQYLSLVEDLLPRSRQPEQRLALARRLARLQEAEGDVAAAARTLRQQLGRSGPADSEALADELIRLELAAGNPRKALTVFKTHYGIQNLTPAELEEGIRIAHLAGSETDRLRWLDVLATQEPSNTAVQRRLLDAQLANGRVEAALETVRRLDSRRSDLDHTTLARMARVLEWNNQSRDALGLWTALNQQHHTDESFARAKALSRSLFDWERLASVLFRAREHRTLSTDDYQWLADALIHRGRLDEARQQLAEAVRTHPDSDALREQQLQLMINMRDFTDAITTLEQRPSLSDQERLRLANLYWRTRQPERAFEVLDHRFQDSKRQETAQLMRLDLGQYLGATEALRADYQRLLSRAGEDRPALTRQLLALAQRLNDAPQVVRLADQRYRQTANPEYLHTKAEYQASLEQWTDLSQTLNRWHEAESGVEQRGRYWSLRARQQHQTGQIEQAHAAYRRAYRLTASDEAVLVSWGWFQLEYLDRFRASFETLLARLATSASPSSEALLAYGYSALDQPDRARQWFLQGLSSHADDPEWLAATARTLDRTGAPGRAHRLRQQALAALPEETEPPIGLLAETGHHRPALNRAQRKLRGDQTISDLEQGAYYAVDRNQPLLAEALLARFPNPSAAHDRIRSLLWPRPETAREQGRRLNRQIDRLARPQSADDHRDLMRDTVTLQRRFPRAWQVGSDWRDVGTQTVQSTGISSRYRFDETTLGLSLRDLQAREAGLFTRQPGGGPQASASIASTDARFDWQFEAQRLQRYDGADWSATLEAGVPVTDRWALSAGIARRERTPDTAEAWWLTATDRVFLGARYALSSRLDLSAQLGRRSVSQMGGGSLGEGLTVDLTGQYALERENPGWVLSANYQSRQLNLSGPLTTPVQQSLVANATPATLLTEDYERVGIATRWFHGEAHALYRTTPSPKAFAGVSAGYVLTTNSPELGVELGLGWRLTGDDELALSGEFSSQGLDGSGRANFNLTYTRYLGR